MEPLHPQNRKGPDPAFTENQINYKVQLAAFRLDPTNDSRIKNLDGLEIVFEDELYRVLAGSYHSRSEADQSKEEWHQKGFRDAFVVRVGAE